MSLEPDRNEIEIFVDAVLRHRGEEGYLSLRAFDHDNESILPRMWAAGLNGSGDFQHIVDHAMDMARRAANYPEPAVFCPPIAVFNAANGWQSREEDLFKGLAISVECDQHPEEARQRLQEVLGEATAIVRSGGQWVNGDGELEDKLHLHWRLKVPATGADLSKLKEARRLATAIAGGDPSNVPAVHCLRWPGSWHRKGAPRLCELVSCNPDVEIDLGTALKALEAVAPKTSRQGNGHDDDHWTGDGERVDLVKLLAGIRPGNVHASQVSATAALLERGMKIGDVVDTVLAVTRLAVGERAWDWAKAARDLRNMCESWEKKRKAKPKTEPIPDPQPQSGPEPPPELDPPPDPGSTKASGWTFHSNTEPEATQWLIKYILPETGPGLISGQWGTYKTTIALDVTVSVMTNTPFAGRFRIKRPGGVVYLALEGYHGLGSRLSTIAQKRGFYDPLPFASRSDCPLLLDPDAVPKLAAMFKEAAAELKRRFGVETVLVFVDTIVDAAGYTKPGDENDAALGQKIMTTLAELSKKTGALAIGIDHFGKEIETGTRGTSTKEGRSDVVLALIAKRELSGAVTDTYLAVRKQREGEAGMKLPFTPKTIEVGRDEDGDPITRVVIEWSEAGAAFASAASEKKEKSWAKSLQLLRRILMSMLVEHGQDIHPFDDDLVVRAVDLKLVRAEFYRQYVVEEDGTEEQKNDARRRAFGRALKKAQADNLITKREIGGRELVWLVKPENGEA